MIDPLNTDATIVDALELDTLAAGERHDLLLHLADDGLGYPIHVPIIVARGAEDGPTVGLVAGLHGNELNGIWVIHELMESLDSTKLRGSVVAVVVANVPGLLRRQRAFSDGHDLNRAFPGRARGSPASMWAHRLRTRIVQQFEWLLDLHTAGAGRLNCVYARVDLDDPNSTAMARLLRPQLVVHKPATDGSLRGWASSHGIPAVTLEIGDPQRRQGDLTSSTVQGSRRVLRWLGVLSGKHPSVRSKAAECRRSRWIFAERGGLLHVLPDVGERVSKGDVVGHLHDVFGHEIERYTAPADAWVVGKSADPVSTTGGRVIHLAYDQATTKVR